MADRIEKQVCDSLVQQGLINSSRVGRLLDDLAQRRVTEPNLTIEEFLAELGFQPRRSDTDDISFHVLEDDSNTTSQETRIPVRQPEEPGGKGRILHFTGGGAWEEIKVPKEGLTVGRGKRNGLKLDDPVASKRHARFRLVNDAWLVDDLNSTNGVHINGPAIRSGSSAPLSHGDLVRLGGSLFLVLKPGSARPKKIPATTESPRIEISRGSLRGRTKAVGDRPLVVGSARDADITVAAPRVSPYHVVLLRRGERLLAQDLKSETGTLHMGQRVKRVALASGESIRVGDCVLTFKFGAAKPRKTHQAALELRAESLGQDDDSALIDPGNDWLDLALGDEMSQPEAPPAEKRDKPLSRDDLDELLHSPWKLRFATGPLKGKTLTIHNRPVSIGRGQEVSLTILDEKLSRRHLVFRMEEDILTFRDLGSRNGVFLNGMKALSGQLQHGDRVAFGASVAFVERDEDR